MTAVSSLAILSLLSLYVSWNSITLAEGFFHNLLKVRDEEESKKDKRIFDPLDGFVARKSRRSDNGQVPNPDESTGFYMSENRKKSQRAVNYLDELYAQRSEMASEIFVPGPYSGDHSSGGSNAPGGESPNEDTELDVGLF